MGRPTVREERGLGAVLHQVVRTLLGALAVVLDGLRLLALHWPVLVTVLLLGAAGREAVLWACVLVSRVSPTGSTLLMPLAPLCTVLALIVALRTVLPSMRNVEGEEAPRSRRLAVVASSLVPFLAVYAAQGYLREDTRRYLVETAADEDLTYNPLAGDSYDGRTWAGAPLWLSITIVVLALVLRWGLDRYRLPEKHGGFGLLAGWVEALWLVTVATALQGYWSSAWGWVLDRQGVAWLLDAWHWLVGTLGSVGSVLEATVGWLMGILGDFDTLVVVPMAWLTVGAVVYGKELGAPVRAPRLAVRERVLGSLEDTRARAVVERAGAGARVVRTRAAILPGWLRAWLMEPITSVTGRFSALGRGLLTLVRAGLVPMVTLCLVLVLARHVGILLALLLRRVLGPQDLALAITQSPRAAILFSVSTTLLMVVLIAAAVDRFLVRPAEEVEVEAPTPPDPPDQPSSAATA